MKNLLVIAILLALTVSCKKQTSDQPNKPQEEIATARANSFTFYHTCANGYADQTGGSEGVAALVNVEKLRLGGAKMKSWWIGAYYDVIRPDGVTERDWVQWGYFTDKTGLDQAFYVYSISPIYSQKWPLTIINQTNNAAPLVAGTKVRFEIKRNTNMNEVPSDTYWSFLRDGVKIFDIDLGATTLNGTLQSCTESWASSSFSNIIHVDYFDFYRDGVWAHLPSANIGAIEWNLEGSRQRPEFKQSEHEFGGKLQPITSYLLW